MKTVIKELETERLLLRKVRKEDYLDIYNSWASDKDVFKYLTWDAHDNPEITKRAVNYWLNEYKKDNTYRWLVVLKESDEVIGMIDVTNKDMKYMTCEIGYTYGKKYWGYGYATEALKEVLDYLHSVGFVVVYAEHFVSNKASGRVMEKAGMKYEATLKSRVVNKDGTREDLLVYSSIKE